MKDLSARLQALVGKEKQLTTKLATKEMERAELERKLDQMEKRVDEVQESEKK